VSEKKSQKECDKSESQGVIPRGPIQS